jgi:HPt (histidine-containing phosphotransfer) domain-containing protein
MCLSAGCTAFLTKPIKQEVLLQAIREHSTAPSPSPQEETGNNETVIRSAKLNIAQLRPEYLQNCRQNVIDMLDALERSDFATVTNLGHNLNGSGGMFGFQTITDMGAALQLAAENSDADASRKWVGELSSYLQGIETISG